MNFLPLIKELVRTYQAFEAYSSAHIRSLGLTPVQFDVIATLANQAPMTYKDLAQKTLISKSSLTGVVERMIQKGFITATENLEDARSQKLVLTRKGQKSFELVFPEHLAHLQRVFDRLTPQEQKDIEKALGQLKTIFPSSALECLK